MGTGRPHLSTLQCRNFSNVEHKFLSPIESQPGPTSVGFGRGWPALACRNLSICTKLQETWLSKTPRVWYAKQHSLWGIRTRLQFSIYGVLNSVPIQSCATGGSGPFAQSALSIQYPASPCQCQFCPSIILPLFLRYSGHFLDEFGLAPLSILSPRVSEQRTFEDWHKLFLTMYALPASDRIRSVTKLNLFIIFDKHL